MSRKIARELSFKVIFSFNFQNENEEIESLINNLENEDNINNKEIEESTNNRENREDNILNNSVEEMEEHWFNIVSERVKNGERMVDILEDLAKNDWSCYQFTKKTIKDKCFKAYSDSRDLFRYLNRKYGPADEYFDVI